ncbi:ATP-binding protein [Planctomicrobium sp. SH661]|uniref:ATP-binding protein n=1 Tax=Planctomicrobium sp. SH661 TaxID=3448124 RepID=UPI003F5BBCA3
MRLSEFISEKMERILQEWEAFAATLLPAAEGMTSLALRDHARDILLAVAHDITTPQTREEQSEKSKGRAIQAPDAPETAAQTHAVMRAHSGFDINQLVAEYRALRASVLRMWIDASALAEPEIDEVIRFNEAIDQAIAESVSHYHALVERHRDLFLGMLGHDMRNPLNAIVVTANYLSTLNAGGEISEAVGMLIRSGSAMQALLDDLVDFNRTNLGLGIEVVPSEIDLAAVVADELEQLRVTHPERQIELLATGENLGRWDGSRLQQLIRNLVSNAIRYGYDDMPVRVTLRGEETAVHLEVTNHGREIDPLMSDQIFNPLRRGSSPGTSHDDHSGLGLGLYIVREIARAHGGEVVVRCSQGVTTFALQLPRRTPTN